MQQDEKNYITPQGLERLRSELSNLRRVERPEVVEVVSWAAGNGDRSENGDYIYGKKRLREIDSRIRYLTKRLEIAEVVDPARQTNTNRIFFGATVTYEDQHGEERTVRIVGVEYDDRPLSQRRIDVNQMRAHTQRIASHSGVGIVEPGLHCRCG